MRRARRNKRRLNLFGLRDKRIAIAAYLVRAIVLLSAVVRRIAALTSVCPPPMFVLQVTCTVDEVGHGTCEDTLVVGKMWNPCYTAEVCVATFDRTDFAYIMVTLCLAYVDPAVMEVKC